MGKGRAFLDADAVEGVEIADYDGMQYTHPFPGEARFTWRVLSNRSFDEGRFQWADVPIYGRS